MRVKTSIICIMDQKEIDSVELSTDIHITIEQEPRARHEMETIEFDLNHEIGFSWWKRYIAGAFWSNIATPINLSLSLITLLTTGQTTTKSLLSESLAINMSIAALVLSLLNTFFAPQNRMTESIKGMNEWRQYANTFEAIYYTDCLSEVDYKRRLEAYRTLLVTINSSEKDSPDTQHFLTDLIHIFVRKCAFKHGEHWMVLKDNSIFTSSGMKDVGCCQ